MACVLWLDRCLSFRGQVLSLHTVRPSHLGIGGSVLRAHTVQLEGWSWGFHGRVRWGMKDSLTKLLLGRPQSLDWGGRSRSSGVTHIAVGVWEGHWIAPKSRPFGGRGASAFLCWGQPIAESQGGAPRPKRFFRTNLRPAGCLLSWLSRWCTVRARRRVCSCC